MHAVGLRAYSTSSFTLLLVVFPLVGVAVDVVSRRGCPNLPPSVPSYIVAVLGAPDLTRGATRLAGLLPGI